MRNRKNTRKEAVFFRFYNDLYCYCQSIRPHPRLWEAPSDRQRTDSTGISPIRCPTSLPATFFSRSDCDWTGVSLSSLWVMAKSGAARYFESVKIGSPPFNRSLPLGRSWRTAAHAYAHHNHKEKVFGEWVFTCQGTPPVFATQRKTGERFYA